jgi:hypothetical protein
VKGDNLVYTSVPYRTQTKKGGKGMLERQSKPIAGSMQSAKFYLSLMRINSIAMVPSQAEQPEEAADEAEDEVQKVEVNVEGLFS